VTPSRGEAAQGNPGDAEVRALLAGVMRIAVVGLSPKPDRDSHRVALYLQQRGYEIVPVYPREETILGAKVYRRVADIPGGVQLVDVFRRADDIPAVVDDVLVAQAPVLWLQFDCVDDEAVRRARAAGVVVVADRCLMVEHRRFFGRGPALP
jgi:predicted CoA-binding protein